MFQKKNSAFSRSFFLTHSALSIAHDRWPFSENMPMLQIKNTSLSRYFYLHIVLYFLAVPRYKAIVNPKPYKGNLSKGRCLLIFLIWLIDQLQFYWMQQNVRLYNPDIFICGQALWEQKEKAVDYLLFFFQYCGAYCSFFSSWFNQTQAMWCTGC